MASTHKIASKCTFFTCFFIFKKCILATYAMFYWYLSLSVIDEHYYGSIFGIRHKHYLTYKSVLSTFGFSGVTFIRIVEKNIVYNSSPSAECDYDVAYFIEMNLLLLGLCLNHLYAPILLALDIFIRCFDDPKLRSSLLLYLSNESIVMVSVFYELVAISLATDFYLMRRRKKMDSRRIKNAMKEGNEAPAEEDLKEDNKIISHENGNAQNSIECV